MRRKILNNYNKSKRIHGRKKGNIGTCLNIHDKNNEVLFVGDTVEYYKYTGVILYCLETDEYGVALSYSMFKDNKYDLDSYWKFWPISLNDGNRMNIKKIS